ncbi:MAG: type IV pilin N-terminal domain-containing protein, partial [Thermoplasmatales archaeon]|nr:type IV pilin N-terminal domain-containing protein [Thermoplasmatales archaeon]
MRFRNKEAISPVIGIILMVAITVLLAAVVYIWVSSIIGGGVKGTPITSYTLTTASNGNYRVILSSTSEKKSVKGYTYLVEDGNGVVVPGMTDTIDTIYSKRVNGIMFCDNDADGHLTTNDFFDIDPVAVGPGY